MLDDKQKSKQNPSTIRLAKRDQTSLPDIPDKLYFSISETGKLCGVKPYVLRFWEEAFAQLKPIKRRGNRRYYQLADILLVREIRHLLYERGFTIPGARAQLEKKSVTEKASPQESLSIDTIINQLESVLATLR